MPVRDFFVVGVDVVARYFIDAMNNHTTRDERNGTTQAKATKIESVHGLRSIAADICDLFGPFFV